MDIRCPPHTLQICSECFMKEEYTSDLIGEDFHWDCY